MLASAGRWSGYRLFGASPAIGADLSSTEEIRGWTEEEFVAAATVLDLGDAAREAWGDPERMNLIPVESVTEGSPTLAATASRVSSEASISSLATAVNYTKTCSQIERNWIGNNIMVLKVTKRWKSDGVRVWPTNVSWLTESAWLWYFDGINGTQNYCTGANTGHNSYISAKFTHPVPPPESRSQWVEVRAKLRTATCAGGSH